MVVLVTGGAGYIGSHTCVELLESGYEVLVVDNLSNSSRESLRRVEKITGQVLKFIKLDLRNKDDLRHCFSTHNIETVMHFAGLKSVAESVKHSTLYHQNNVEGTLNLCAAMEIAGVKDLIFSSSATVYGMPKSVPISEEFPLLAVNPYGQTKIDIENNLRGLSADNEQKDEQKKTWRIVLLRYFNPVGAHASGLIGEDPSGIPNNLVPYISRVAIGSLEELSVYGGDYSTKDGTGVRDYIHVADLAKGHVNALRWLKQGDSTAICETFNLGTGKGYSVLEMISAFEKQSGQAVPYKIVERRAGDVAECFADVTKAKEALHWQAEKTLDEMMADTWRWQSENPKGYSS